MPNIIKETVTDEVHKKTVEYGGFSNGQPTPMQGNVPKALPQSIHHKSGPSLIYDRVMAGAVFVASPPNMAKLDFPSAPASLGPIGNPAAALAGFTISSPSYGNA
jgi:hypothetical protein